LDSYVKTWHATTDKLLLACGGVFMRVARKVAGSRDGNIPLQDGNTQARYMLTLLKTWLENENAFEEFMG